MEKLLAYMFSIIYMNHSYTLAGFTLTASLLDKRHITRNQCLFHGMCLFRYCSRFAQTVTDFADASHSESAKSTTTTVLYGIFSSENSYPCTVTLFLLRIFLTRGTSPVFYRGRVPMRISRAPAHPGRTPL